jgi:large subunit ribosomal protein L29
MKASEVRQLSDPELTGKLSQLKTELFNLRFQAATSRLENPSRIRQVRKDIARLSTVWSERQLAEEARV